VDLILTPAGAAAAPELPLPVSPDGQRVGPVVLLSDRARTVFVGRPMARPSSLASSVKRERAVGVERRNIEAIVFLTRGEARPE
jgi:hypothetical protein